LLTPVKNDPNMIELLVIKVFKIIAMDT
jgi:hypothetical protein